MITTIFTQFLWLWMPPLVYEVETFCCLWTTVPLTHNTHHLYRT